MDNIGNKIKTLRKRTGLSQTELAQKVEISKQTLYKYENNIIKSIPPENIERIAHALSVHPASLMGWDEKEDDKSSLYDAYERLNDNGRKKLLDYAEDLLSSGNYRR